MNYVRPVLIALLATLFMAMGIDIGRSWGRAEQKKLDQNCVPQPKPAGCEGIFLEGYGDEVHFAKAQP